MIACRMTKADTINLLSLFAKRMNLKFHRSNAQKMTKTALWNHLTMYMREGGYRPGVIYSRKKGIKPFDLDTFWDKCN
jgi:hypothetical protein